MPLNLFDLNPPVPPSRPLEPADRHPIPTPRPDLLPEAGPIPTPRPITDMDVVAIEMPATATPSLAASAPSISDADVAAVEVPQAGDLSDADIVAVEPPAEQGILERVGNSLVRGKNNILDQSLNTLGFLTGILTPEEAARAMLQDQQEAAAAPRDPRTQAGLDEIQEAGQRYAGHRIYEREAKNEANDPLLRSVYAGLAARTQDAGKELLGAAVRNPGTIMDVAVESLPALGPTLAGGLAGGLAGSVAGPAGAGFGAAAGAGLGSGTIEFLTSMQEYLQSKGMGNSEASLAKVLSDPALLAEARDFAAKRGVAVGVFDALGAGLAGRLRGPVERTLGTGLAGRTAGLAAEAAGQGATGASGEAAAQVATTGEVNNPAAVLLEGAAEIPAAALEVPGHVLARRPGEKLSGAHPAATNTNTSTNNTNTSTNNTNTSTNTDATQVPDTPGPGPGPQGPTRTTPPGFTPDPEPSPEPNTSPDPNAAPSPAVAQPPVQPAQPTPVQPPAQAVQPAQSAVQSEPEPTTSETPAAAPQAPAPAPAAPAPVRTPTPVLSNATGEKVVTPDGEREIDTEFQVVEADDLKAAEGQLQPRDRAGRSQSDLQVQRIAAQLDPLRLASSRESDRGAPIIDDDNVILSGNGRTAAIIQASQTNPERYEAYRQHLASLGFNIEGMKTPVLVRRAKGISAEDKRRFAIRSNSDGGLGLSPSERAGIEQDYITTDMLAGFDTDAEGGVSAASNAGFVRQFLRNVPPNEQASFVNSDNKLTPSGAKRIAGAIFARAYGDKSMIERFVEDENDPAIRNALTGAAGAWARMRDAVGGKDLDITKDLVEAINLVNRARSAGVPLPRSLEQMDAFNTPSDIAVKLAGLFYNHTGNRLAAWRDIRDRLVSYAEQAERTQNATGDIFGGPGPTAESILDGIRQGIERRNAQQQPTLPVAAKQPAPGGELFTGSEVLSKGPKRGGAANQAQTPGPLLDRLDNDQFEDEFTDLFDEGVAEPIAESTRIARGSMTPGMEQVSFSHERSIYEEIFNAAGIDPDRGVLLPPARKMQVLKQVLEQTFGLTVDLNVRGKPILAPDAINQMMNAYRNVRFMLHVLDLPLKAISLNGRLTLALEKFKGQYLGAYYPEDHSIHIPGRSNSFAHEWAHALDHYLIDRLQPGSKALFSQVARNKGLDPNQSLDAAFVNLIHKMFFDEADLAARIMRLEVEAQKQIKSGPNAGQPTQAALKAREQIERLAAGATRIRIKPSKFRQSSAQFDPRAADYYASVHEMLARAFEAWIASKVAAAGGTNEFITKGDEAYLSDADRRLAMTFPKLEERAAIFAAFEDVFHHIRTQAILGTGPATARPSADEAISDPMHWHKQAMTLDRGLLKAAAHEAMQVRNAVKYVFSQPAAAWRNYTVNLGIGSGTSREKLRQAAADVGRTLFYSTAGLMRTINKRNEGKGGSLLSYLTDKLTYELGSGRDRQGTTYDEEWQQFVQSYSARIEDVLKANGFTNLKFVEAENDTVRDLMFGKQVQNADPRLVKVAAELRRIYDDAFQHARAAGVDFGYVTDKGYVQRVLVTDRVQDNPEAFIKDAKKVYAIVYDDLFDGLDLEEQATTALRLASILSKSTDWANPTPMEPATRGAFAAEIKAVRLAFKKLRAATDAAQANPLSAKAAQDVEDAQSEAENATLALIEVLADPYATVSAVAWTQNIVIGKSNTYDSHGPLTQFTKKRTLPSAADDILADWYQTDAISLAVDYAGHVGKKAAYQRRFGNPQGNQEFDKVIARREVQYQINTHPRRYDIDTEAGRLAIIRDLANPRIDNILEMALATAQHFGADGRDVRQVRSIIQTMTGRRDQGALATIADRVSGWVYVYTYVRLLPRAAWASITEPMTVFLKTGDVGVSVRSLAYYAREAFRGAKSVQELSAFARATGIVASQLADINMLNRLSADYGQNAAGNVILARFFRLNLLAQLTNAQRRAVMGAGFFWFQDLAARLRDPSTDSIKKGIIRAEFRDHGIPERHIDAMADWLTQSPEHPSLDDLKTPMGKMYASMVARFVDTTIQNPRRMDKPLAASGPMGRLVYGLTSFLYKFFDSVQMATLRKAKRNYNIARDEGASKLWAALEGASPVAINLTAGFITLTAAQTLVTVLREAIFNGDMWEEKERKGELSDWLVSLAISRTGLFGPADTVFNALTGLRYERDLASLGVGAGPAMLYSDVQNIINGLPHVEGPYGPLTGARNNENTNTAEHQAAKSFYRMVLAPAMNVALAAIETQGPVSRALGYAAMAYGSSAQAASTFADKTVGEKTRRGGEKKPNPFTAK